MDALSSREYEGLMTFAKAVIDSETSLDWWEAYTDLAMGVLFHAEVVAVASIDLKVERGIFGMIRPAWAELAVPTGSAMHEDLIADHPLTPHLRGRRARQAVRVSDLVPELRWRNMAGYSKMRELVGATQQLSMTLRASPLSSLSTSPLRHGKDFTAHELEVAEHLQGLLVSADRHSRTRVDQRGRQGPAEQRAGDEVAADLRLTRRERVVLGLMADGLTATSVARALAVSPRTVGKHQQNVYRKLGVSDRLAAVLRAQRLGLLLPRPAAGAAGEGGEGAALRSSAY